MRLHPSSCTHCKYKVHTKIKKSSVCVSPGVFARRDQSPDRTMNASLDRNLTLAEWIVAGLTSLLIVHLHWLFLQHAGGLWRDEVGIANIATLPSLAEVWAGLPHDHCPILFPAIVRTWCGAGLGETDFDLRILGFGIGLLLLASFWTASRIMGRHLPLLSLAFAALNATVIRYGDSLRAYGLATACLLLTMAFTWRFIETPKWRHWLPAAAAAVLSVQSLYQNAFLVLAVCLAGFTVCIHQHQRQKALGVLGIGLAAALTLVPYIKPMLAAQDWWIVSKSGNSLGELWGKVSVATGFPLPFFTFVWVLLVITATLLGISRISTGTRQPGAETRPDLALFAAVALVTGGAGFALFIALACLPTQIWYYVPLIGFTAVCCNTILPRAHRVARIGMLIAAAATAILSYPRAHTALQWRQTSGDIAAARVSQEADAGDLIIVHPWAYAITFNRHYRGVAPWVTLPPLEDYRFHRYDLIKPKLQLTNPIAPVLDNVKTTLESGHLVWIVGRVPVPPPGAPPPDDLPVAPNGPQGWFDAPYVDTWGGRLGHLLINHITNATALIDPATMAVNPMENMGVVVVSGWRDSAKTNAP